MYIYASLKIITEAIMALKECLWLIMQNRVTIYFHDSATYFISLLVLPSSLTSPMLRSPRRAEMWTM